DHLRRVPGVMLAQEVEDRARVVDVDAGEPAGRPRSVCERAPLRLALGALLRPSRLVRPSRGVVRARLRVITVEEAVLELVALLDHQGGVGRPGTILL